MRSLFMVLFSCFAITRINKSRTVTGGYFQPIPGGLDHLQSIALVEDLFNVIRHARTASHVQRVGGHCARGAVGWLQVATIGAPSCWGFQFVSDSRCKRCMRSELPR